MFRVAPGLVPRYRIAGQARTAAPGSRAPVPASWRTVCTAQYVPAPSTPSTATCWRPSAWPMAST